MDTEAGINSEFGLLEKLLMERWVQVFALMLTLGGPRWFNFKKTYFSSILPVSF